MSNISTWKDSLMFWYDKYKPLYDEWDKDIEEKRKNKLNNDYMEIENITRKTQIEYNLSKTDTDKLVSLIKRYAHRHVINLGRDGIEEIYNFRNNLGDIIGKLRNLQSKRRIVTNRFLEAITLLENEYNITASYAQLSARRSKKMSDENFNRDMVIYEMVSLLQKTKEEAINFTYNAVADLILCIFKGQRANQKGDISGFVKAAYNRVKRLLAETE